MSDDDLRTLTVAAALFSVGIGSVGMVFRRGDLTLNSCLAAAVTAWCITEMQERGMSESFGMWPAPWLLVCFYMGAWTYDMAIEWAKETVEGWDRKGLPKKQDKEDDES